MTLKASLTASFIFPLLGAVGTPALADYPERPVRVLVGYGPGGGADVIARVIADSLAQNLGAAFVVENKPGGTTTLAASLLAAAPTDGYTLMLTTVATPIAASVTENLSFDYGKLTSIASIATNDFAVIVPFDSEIHSLEDLRIRAATEELTFSSSGVNSPSHLITAELGQALGLSMIHVPYSGANEAMTAVLGGEVDLNLSVTANAAPMVSSGKVRALGVTSVSGSAQLPGVMSVASQGIEGYEAVTWYGLIGPENLSQEVIAKLNTALNATLENEEVKAKLTSFGYTLRGGSAEAFRAFSDSETARWSAVAKTAFED